MNCTVCNLSGIVVSVIIHLSVILTLVLTIEGGELSAKSEIPISMSMFQTQTKHKPKSDLESGAESEPKLSATKQLEVAAKPEQKPNPASTVVHKLKPELTPSKPTLALNTATTPLVKKNIQPSVNISSQQLIDIRLMAEKKYKDHIFSLIESNKFFPKHAKKLRKGGDVMIEFTLNRDGSIKNLKIIKASGPYSLKNAALKAIKKSAIFPQFPEQSQQKSWSFRTTLKYRLR